MSKYTTLTEIAGAFKSGELDESYAVQIDKGGCELSLTRLKDYRDKPDEEDADYEECQKLFQREYDDCLKELFRLAGIPCQFA